jgi:hypothetical protein
MNYISGLHNKSFCTPGIRLRAIIADDYAILGSGCWLGFAGQDWIIDLTCRFPSKVFKELSLSHFYGICLAQADL